MGGVGGNAHYDYSTTTATPWMSLMKAMCMISGLFTRNTSVQENTRGLHEHLHAVILGSPRKCPPMELATVVWKAEWMMMRNDWSKVGSAFLGQYSEESVQATNQVSKEKLCAPPDVYSSGLSTPSYAPNLDRAAIKLP
eukprot:8093850-Pyramimonas_sp.AAC.1